jgi:hypothetical protein
VEEEEQRKRWRKGRQNSRGGLCRTFPYIPSFLCEVETTPVAAGGSLKNSESKYVVMNRLVANVEGMVQDFGFAILLAHVFGWKEKELFYVHLKRWRIERVHYERLSGHFVRKS